MNLILCFISLWRLTVGQTVEKQCNRLGNVVPGLLQDFLAYWKWEGSGRQKPAAAL